MDRASDGESLNAGFRKARQAAVFFRSLCTTSEWRDRRRQLRKPKRAKDNLAFSSDAVKLETWHRLTGYRSAVTYVDKKTIIAVGTNGSDITRDGGKTWKILGKEDLNAVAAKGKKAVWAVGPKAWSLK